MNTFTCFSLSPIGLEHPGLAIATSRAGGVGVLDLEFCRDSEQATRNLDKLLELVNPSSQIGLRLKVDQVADSQKLLQRLLHRSHWIILAAWEAPSLAEVIACLPQCESRRLLLEVTDVEQAQAIDYQSAEIFGLVAKGQESGGWVGEDPAFILTQKLLNVSSQELVDIGTTDNKQILPIYVQGGIGIHTAAGVLAAGAAGVVLDDQLWLMPESPLPGAWQRYLNNLNGQEAIAIGDRLNRSCRVLSRPGFQAITALQQLAEKIEIQELGTGDWGQGSTPSISSWQQAATSLIGWDSPGTLAWPMGQAVGLAAHFRLRYKTTGKLIQAILKQSLANVKKAEELQPLAPNSPLAASHGTRYPIMQGPMTRVSDKAEFAIAVNKAGALPMLALALMRGKQVEELLQETKQKIGSSAWGVGILGFVPQALREEQLQVVKAVKPPFALIAGGRPDQAADLEAEGIATYLHVPTPGLLQMFLEQGARRFVFEGRECGGHVGPLSSFMLWESAIETLLKDVPAGAETEIHVFFAGGIHDARSAATISAIAAPLVERGMKIGVLMGTAYLFTEEAVKCGAIVDGFQRTALTCTHTINLETGPGHASRCAITPFAQEFYATRRKMLAAGHSPEEIKNVLEDLTLGRLRVASKGLVRDEQGIVPVETQKQLTDGMYMIGQVATLRNSVCTLEELHQDVSQKSSELLVHSNEPSTVKNEPSPSDVAIVGLSTLLPKAEYPDTFWENILHKVSAITEIPAHRWDWRLYYNPDRTARDKIYSKWGGFIDDVQFDPVRYGIPPKSVKSIDPIQLLALEGVRRALADAGYESGDFDRENTSVIFGAATGAGDLAHQYATRSHLSLYVDEPSEQTLDRLPEWTEESFPGILLNVAAGRAANRFDFGGVNFAVDAACASSLAAISLAVRELESGRSNVVIAGGVDTGQSPFAYLTFSKTQALSPQQQPRAFDKAADGIVISEGIVILVLKRLADAERDGDRIYAVIKSVAGSSDGKALGLTAPRPAGQMRALDRAYSQAGFSPNTLGLYEAHGTGTVAGDRAEAETVTETLKAADTPPKSCVIGSVKTVIGHTKSSAGVAGLAKATLALHNAVLPPHLGVENPLDTLADPQSPVYLLKEAKPWLTHPNYPRRAGVSAFGFGGTNFHVVLEEYRGNLRDRTLGADTWPCELFVFKAANSEALTKEIGTLLAALRAGATPRLRDLAYSYSLKAQTTSHNVCLSIVAESLQQLQAALELVINQDTQQPLPPHIQLSSGNNNGQKIAFLFPGQGSQYPDMARSVALYRQEMRAALEFADHELQQCFPKLLSQFIYPPSAYSEEQEALNQKQLTDTQIAQPAIGAVETGFIDLVANLGLKPDMVCGHSYGEYTALYAAGVLSRQDFLHLSQTRGKIMAAACKGANGAMAAVQMQRPELQARLASVEGVVIANHNAPLQTVISGDKDAIAQIVDQLNAEGIMARMLPVKGAFHSPLVASALNPLIEAIDKVTLRSPTIPVYANSTACPYDADSEAISTQLSKHLIHSVEFVSQINAMYAAGARIFVEVGPKSILTKLVGQILEGKDHIVVSLDGQGGGMRGFLIALGTLCTQGINIQLPTLFEGRNVRQLDLSLPALTKKPDISPTTWLLTGASSRPIKDAVGHMGKIPLINQDTAAQSKVLNAKQPEQETALPVVGTSGSSTRSAVKFAGQHQEEENKKPTTNPVPTSCSAKSPQPSALSPGVAPKLTMTPYPEPQPAPSPSASALTGETALAAYQAYQETMRQFLGLQEQVMKQFLGGVNYQSPQQPQQIPSKKAIAPTPRIVTNFSQPSGNGSNNGAKTPEVLIQNTNDTAIAPVVPTPQPDIQLPVVTRQPSVVQTTTNNAQLPDRAALTEKLLQLVSDRTGYPTEMLGLNADMEAELGIDSIKRVEILGALQKSLPEPFSSLMRSRMENFTRAKTLNSVVELLNSQLTTNSQQPTTNNQQLLDRTALTEKLLQLVSDRTGYPTEMLGLNADMEAELGIDSIKRVEILGALQKSLSEPLASNVRSRMENFTRAKTLNSVVEQLLKSGNVPEENNSLGKSLPR
ncbi:acyltransferase domain-containing protein [Trichocoleus sp. FACHB-90]|uniref:type I polyketide synthase n=1 Tax=Cyanophyceae TaxID=3028117 RepID=UPI0016859820|nr:type I polyketide synthase [Trichocoleus sp. FACHB-90]MBD1927137.1 acyltransferase domain-containing protein [Trichocoleus sp. FACHB-90]